MHSELAGSASWATYQTAMLEIARQLAPLVAQIVPVRGSTAYVGQITTAGRTEVTALGDEVNEAARIEACAAGGRILASKDLIKRLDDADAAALELDPARITYTPLAELPGVTDKARRDAPAIPVCEL